MSGNIQGLIGGYSSPAGPSITSRVLLSFNTSPGFLVDEGLAGSTWTNINGLAAQSSSPTPKHGDRCVTFAAGSNAYGLSTPATTGNTMNGSGDCAMGGWFQNSGVPGANGYLCGVRKGPGYGAADSGVFFFIGGAGDDLYMYYSDGTTLSAIQVTTGGWAGSTWSYLLLERYSGKLYASINGIVANSGGTTFTGTIPVPSSTYLYCGMGDSASLVNRATAVDMFQVWDYSPYHGANFTPPVVPV